ncbi:MAG: hypothetical protein ACFCBV_13810 [Phycisphaerales bacterium]
MARTPSTEQAFISFARTHIDIWSGGEGQPPVIGLSSQQLLDTESATAAAEAAYSAMLAARDASRAATEAKDNALDALKAVIGADVDTIDAFAKATTDPNVWVLAQIPAPKDPSERTAPDAPVIGEVLLTSGGIVRVPFTVATGGGAQYQIERRDTPLAGTTSDWFPIATTTDKTFSDQSIPFGLTQVQYRVRAQLSSGPASPWSTVASFSFGSTGSVAGPAAAADAA